MLAEQVDKALAAIVDSRDPVEYRPKPVPNTYAASNRGSGRYLPEPQPPQLPRNLRAVLEGSKTAAHQEAGDDPK